MPLIVVTPDADPLPSRAVSEDGTLTATSDVSNGGVLLRANFATTWGIEDLFTDGTYGWQSTTAASVTRITSDSYDTTGVLQWQRSATVSQISRPCTTLPLATIEQKLVVTFDIAATAANTVTVNLGNQAVTGIPVGTTWRTVLATFHVSAGASFNTVSLTANGTGTLRVDNFRVVLQYPTGINFYRDGQPVRGASPAPASNGIAYAYDYEITFGQAALWTAQPVYTIRNTYVQGQVGASVSLSIPDLDVDRSLSLKSLSYPTWSRKLIGKWPAATRSWEGRDTLTANPGASLMSGSWDVPVAQPETWVVETTTRDEAADLERLLLSGPLLLQHAATQRRNDTFTVVKTVSCDYKTGPLRPELLWTVSFQPVARPTPVGASALIPFRSYQDMDDVFQTYNGVAAGLVSYDSFFVPVTQLIGQGWGLQPWGTTPFGT